MAPRLNLPPLTRIILALLLAFCVLRYVYAYSGHLSSRNRDHHQATDVPYLEIVPASCWIFPWVFLTATLVDQYILILMITGVTIFYGGKYLERAWSSAEFGKFLLIVSLLPNVITCVLCVVAYALTGYLSLITTAISGGAALQAGFLVAFKQLVPEHTVTIAKGIIKIRVKHFPALYLLVHIISAVVLGTWTAAILAVLGFFSSWTYLRFYKQSFPDLSSSQPATLRGDASETFAFAYFFPDPLHDPVAAVADIVYNCLVTIKLCTPFSAADIDAGNSQANARGEGGLSSILARGGVAQPASGGARAEAERRRALALKALDQRLHAATSQAQNAGEAATPMPQAESQVAAERHETPRDGEGQREQA